MKYITVHIQAKAKVEDEASFNFNYQKLFWMLFTECNNRTLKCTE